MSGGSFDYLCHKEADDFFCSTRSLEEMAAALTEAGAHDAAEETEKIIAYVQHAKRQIEVRRQRLVGVWKAMEWWRSADWGEDKFYDELNKYRGV